MAFITPQARIGYSNALIATHALPPQAALFSACRVSHKLLTEHDGHYAVGHYTRADPAGNESELFVPGYILARFCVGSGLKQQQRPDELGLACGQPQADEATHRETQEVARGTV